MATVRLDQKNRALVRAIPNSYKSALANFFGSGPQDIDLANTQHKQYCEALESCGVSVTMLEADHNHPDCLFVEDQAVIVDGTFSFQSQGIHQELLNSRQFTTS